MKCQDCHDLLQRQADGEELVSRVALAQHLRGCAECRAFQHGLARLVEVAVLNRPAPPSSEFSDRLLAAVLADVPVTPEAKPARWPWVTVLALAASLLVGLALYSWLATPKPITPIPEVAEAPKPQNLRDSMREAGTALTALTTRTADEVVEATRQLIPSVSAPAMPTLDPMTPFAEPPARSLTQTGSVVAEGFQPVTDSARRAFDLFLREIPMPETNPGL